MVSALMELVLDNKDDTGQEHATEWINLVDRGGLWCIKSGIFWFFCAIEEELCSYLTVSSVKELSAGMKHTMGMKHTIISTIINSDNVALYWCMLCTDAEEELLMRIVELWVTIRGFSFIHSWMEMFQKIIRNAHSVPKYWGKTCISFHIVPCMLYHVKF